MKELMAFAFSAPNLTISLLLIVVFAYWILMLFGALDVDFIDIDVDVDVDVDADVDISGGSGGGLWIGLLQFMNAGSMPFMIIFSVLILAMWTLTIIANYYLGVTQFGLGLLMMLPAFLVGAVITKAVTTPLKPIFKSLNQGHVDANLVGMIAKVTIPVSVGKLGQVEVLVDEDSLLIYVKCKSGALKRDDRVEIIEHIKEKNYYLVQATEEEV